MNRIPLTTLEPWIKRKIGLAEGDALSRKALDRHQRLKLETTVAHACARSPYYRERLGPREAIPPGGSVDLASLPFTTAEDLCESSLAFLCVSQSDISRVFTVQTWESRPKRLYFSPGELESTVDFFHHGMSGIAEPGQRVLILMPGERPESVGDLLRRALSRLDVTGFVHGLVQDPEQTLRETLSKEIDCLVGIPAQVLALARHPAGAALPRGRIQSVLLSSDRVPQAIVDELTEVWGCRVFEHYGMTEMGFGGGVQCRAHAGYHLREADMLFEIIDPGTGRAVPDGETGEIVFTTLTREAMPLIRYRTGDLARFLPEPCPCGSVLKRMSRIKGRLRGSVTLGNGHELSIADLDDALFRLPGITDFEASVLGGVGGDRLTVQVHAAPAAEEGAPAAVMDALRRIPALAGALGDGVLRVDPVTVLPQTLSSSGMAKRTIRDLRSVDTGT